VGCPEIDVGPVVGVVAGESEAGAGEPVGVPEPDVCDETGVPADGRGAPGGEARPGVEYRDLGEACLTGVCGIAGSTDLGEVCFEDGCEEGADPGCA
jgi:hypothetical protein